MLCAPEIQSSPLALHRVEFLVDEHDDAVAVVRRDRRAVGFV